jgi:hypothetical protein
MDTYLYCSVLDVARDETYVYRSIDDVRWLSNLIKDLKEKIFTHAKADNEKRYTCVYGKTLNSNTTRRLNLQYYMGRFTRWNMVGEFDKTLIYVEVTRNPRFISNRHSGCFFIIPLMRDIKTPYRTFTENSVYVFCGDYGREIIEIIDEPEECMAIVIYTFRS